MSRSLRTGLVFLAAGLAGSCATGGRWTKDDYRLGYGPPFLEPATLSAPVGAMEDVSARILVVADNQRHELLGSDIPGFRNTLSDWAVSVAIRPPQLDLYGQDLLREALLRTDAFVLHLGDACDLSNTGEFARFAWDMQLAPRGWLMAPGNHDGFFVGNVSRVGADWVRQWDDSGETYEEDGTTVTSRALQKDRYVSFYLAAIVLQDAPWCAPLARRLGPDCAAIHAAWRDAPKPRTFAGYWQHLDALQEAAFEATVTAGQGPTHRFDLSDDVPAGTGGSLRRIIWNIDVEKPWRSYVTQEIDISSGPDTGDPVSVLVLDTAQYYYLPAMDNVFVSALARVFTLGLYDLQLAGTHGNVLETQAESVAWMTDAMRAEDRRWVVASHHPYSDLGRVSPPRFDAIRAAGGIPVTLSAHTHAGDIRWNHDGDNEGDWLEINVGSLLDAPAEYRDFQVHRLGERFAVGSRRFGLKDVLRRDGLLAEALPGFRPSPGDPDDYMNYQEWGSHWSSETERAVKRVLLVTHLRMFRLFATDTSSGAAVAWPVRADGAELRGDAAVLAEIERLAALPLDATDVDELTHFLYALREFDRTRPLPAARRHDLRAYRLSQAIWASEAEHGDTTRDSDVDPDISFLLLPALGPGDP